MTELTARVVLTGDSSGLAGAAGGSAAALDQVTASAARASGALGTVSAASDATQKALAGQTLAAAAAAKASDAAGVAQLAQFNALTQQANAANNIVQRMAGLAQGQSAYNSTVAQARVLLASGVIGQAEYGAAIEGATAKLALARAESSAGSVAFIAERDAAVAFGVGLAGFGEEAEQGALHLGHIALAAERLGAASGLGIVNARVFVESIRGFGMIMGTPLGAIVAVTAAIVALVAAEEVFESSENKLAIAVLASNDALHMSSDGYNKLASDVAAAADTSQRGGRTIVEAFLNAGAQSEPALKSAADAVQGYAALTGQSADKAHAAIARMFSDPAQAASDLTQKYGLFNTEQLKMIDNLQAAGDTAAAQQIVMAKLDSFVQQFAGHTTALGNAWTGALNAMSNAFDWLGAHPNPFAAAMGMDVNPPDPVNPNVENVQVNPADLQRRAADAEAINKQAQSVNTLVDSYDRIGTALAKFDADEAAVHAAAASGAITADQEAKGINLIEAARAKLTQTTITHTAAVQKLSDLEKSHLDTIKNLIDHSQEAIAVADDEASSLEKQAAGADGSSYAMKALTDQLAIQKATQPYVTALTYAHGAAADKLRAILDTLTDALKRQKQAQEEIAAVSNIKSQFGSLSEFFSGGPGQPGGPGAADANFIQQESAKVYAQAAQDADDWKQHSLDELAAWVAGTATSVQQAGDLWNKYASEIDDIFNSKIAKAYTDDLAHRTDWQAGIERGQIALNDSTSNWAKTSESLMSGLAQQTEDDFVKMVVSGKSTLGDFFTWIEEQLLKLAYQKFLSAPIDNALGGLMGDIGSALGLDTGGAASSGMSVPGVGAATSDGTGSMFADMGAWLSSVFHQGGIVGDPGAPGRYVHPAYFDNAPRFHGGGLVDGEVPIIAQSGERVLTAQQNADYESSMSRPIMINMPSASQPPMSVHIHEAPGTKATAGDPQKQPDGSWQMDVMVEQLDRSLASRSQQGRSVFTNSLENTHGIRRSPRG